MPNHHEIEIYVVGGVKVETPPEPILYVGDTVHYSSPHGKARVFFPSASPYLVSNVDDAQTHTLQEPGKFRFQCFVIPTGKTQEIGWDPSNPQAGGEHDVHS